MMKQTLFFTIVCVCALATQAKAQETPIFTKDGATLPAHNTESNTLIELNKADSMHAEQEIIELSKQKWLWMADKNVDTLADLFHEKSMFVHMGGSWGKDRELEVIRSGGIHYKKADIHEVTVNIIDDTAIQLNKITLLAVVGGNEVTNPFMVTEVYVKENGKWKLGALSFTKLLAP